MINLKYLRFHLIPSLLERRMRRFEKFFLLFFPFLFILFVFPFFFFPFNTASSVRSGSKRLIFHVKYSCNTAIVFRFFFSFARVVCVASSNASFALDFSPVCKTARINYDRVPLLSSPPSVVTVESHEDTCS